MAILTFEMGEGIMGPISANRRHLEFSMLFGHGRGQVAAHEARNRIRRIRGIAPCEAVPLAEFLLEAGALTEFRRRMAPEDWDLLVKALPLRHPLAA